MAAVIWLGSLDPARELGLMAWAAIVVTFMAATQDIVIDAYRIEILKQEEQGAGSAMTQYGYRFGMLASGAGALYLSDHMPWSSVYAIEAALLLIGMATVLFAREPVSKSGAAPASAGSRARSSGAVGRLLKEMVVDPFLDFLRRPWWVAVLAFVVLYRFPDTFLSVMANVFYKDIGFTNSEIASVSKLFGTVATLVGVFLGGVMVHRLRSAQEPLPLRHRPDAVEPRVHRDGAERAERADLRRHRCGRERVERDDGRGVRRLPLESVLAGLCR